MNEFKLNRLGKIMEPEPGNPQEVEGVLNPAAIRRPDGKLYLFSRLVAKGNFRALASSAVITLDHRIVSMSIMEWLTTELMLHDLMCRVFYLRK